MTRKVVATLLLFDLDGTLVDSAKDIALSVNELLVGLGRSPLPLEQIYGYIGSGVRKLLSRALAEESEAALDAAQARYLPIYRRRLLDHTVPYPGVEEGVRSLQRANRALVVLTNKPRREARELLSGLGLAKRFHAIEGGDSFSHRKPHPIGVQTLLERFHASPSECLFVGDSAIDLATARNAGVPCCLVRYGLGFTPDLDPDYFVNDLRELAPIANASRKEMGG